MIWSQDVYDEDTEVTSVHELPLRPPAQQAPAYVHDPAPVLDAVPEYVRPERTREFVSPPGRVKVWVL